ncbi:MAG: aspartate peptidase [Microgenomates bacterium 39_7]|nr:MAG: aspartate peptidase [Microgenomates bacterium 39_7]
MLQLLSSTIEIIITTSPLLYFTLFIFGLIFGSFFKVVVDRSAQIYELEQESLSLKDKIHEQLGLLYKKIFSKKTESLSESWHQGRSRCDHCDKQLAWYDNIPLLSFVLLRGKCRYCQQKIDFSYPLNEFLCALIFVFAGFIVLEKSFVSFFPISVALLFALFTLSTLWLIFLFDWKYMIIPDELVLILSGLGVIKLIVSAVTQNNFIWVDLIVALSLFVVFLILRYVPLLILKKEGMGWGDIKLIVPLGLVLGYQRSLIGVFCAFIIGGVWGIILLISRKAKRGQMVSFGPLLVLGALIALGWGLELWQFYWRLL